MNAIMGAVRRRPQATFWAIAWSTSWFGYAMSVRYPSDLWLLFIFGPFVGGALVTAIVDGRRGLGTFFGRLARWRVGARWYGVALLLPLALRLAAFGLNVLSGAPVVAAAAGPGWRDLLLESLVLSSLIAVAEEPGFRGFALPRLLAGRSAALASLILGVLHTIWHLPLIVGGEEPLVIVPIILAGAVLLTWLFNHTGGSVLLAMLMHASVDVWVGVFNRLFTPVDAAAQTVWLAVVYVAAAAVLVWRSGPELGRPAGGGGGERA